MRNAKTLVQVNFKHDYYSTNCCKDLVLYHPEFSEKVLQQSGIEFLYKEGKLLYYYDKEKEEDFCDFLEEESITLFFYLYSINPMFCNFTEYGAQGRDSILFFSNSEGTTLKKTLSKQESVSRSDLRAIADEEIASILTKKEKALPPIGIVKVQITKSLFFKSKDQNKTIEYDVQFTSKETQWVYHIIKKGSSNFETISIRDCEDQIVFSHYREKSFLDGTPAQVIQSSTPLPFRERSPYKFQLIKHGRNIEKVVLKNLPVASPHRIEFLEEDGLQGYKTNIFIYY